MQNHQQLKLTKKKKHHKTLKCTNIQTVVAALNHTSIFNHSFWSRQFSFPQNKLKLKFQPSLVCEYVSSISFHPCASAALSCFTKWPGIAPKIHNKARTRQFELNHGRGWSHSLSVSINVFVGLLSLCSLVSERPPAVFTAGFDNLLRNLWAVLPLQRDQPWSNAPGQGKTGVKKRTNLDLCRGGTEQIDFHLNTSHSQGLAGCCPGNRAPFQDSVCT